MALLIDGSPGSYGTDHGRQKRNIVLPYRSMSTAVKKNVHLACKGGDDGDISTKRRSRCLVKAALLPAIAGGRVSS